MNSLRHFVRRYLPKPLVAILRGRKEGIRFILAPDLLIRWRILERFQVISESVECTQSEAETLLVARGVLALGGDVPGVIVECGCYKGG